MYNNSRKPDSFIQKPTYPGGKQALNDFIKTHLKYPEEALKNKIEGTVSIEYDVDVFGKVILTKVKHGIGYGCDEEARRVTSLLKYPKKRYQGMRVVFHMTINIHFKLNTAVKAVPPEQKVVYSYVQNEKSKTETGYTININQPNSNNSSVN